MCVCKCVYLCVERFNQKILLSGSSGPYCTAVEKKCDVIRSGMMIIVRCIARSTYLYIKRMNLNIEGEIYYRYDVDLFPDNWIYVRTLPMLLLPQCTPKLHVCVSCLSGSIRQAPACSGASTALLLWYTVFINSSAFFQRYCQLCIFKWNFQSYSQKLHLREPILKTAVGAT